jgi:hypothetical protein
MQRAHCSRHALSLIAALLLYPPLVSAECGCLWEGSFTDIANQASVVIAGTVRVRKGNSVDIGVEEALRGDPYRDELRVWMQTRQYCRPAAETFPPGSRWVMALTRIDSVPDDGFDPGTPNQSYGRVGDYYLSSCGGYWLEYEGEAVTGNLVEAPRWAREVEMTPVLIGLVRAFLNGKASADALAEASREDPALSELLLDTKAFLRGQDDPE